MSNGISGVTSGRGYTLQANSGTYNPADNTTYFCGSGVQVSGSSAGNRRLHIPSTGTITNAYFVWWIQTVLGTNEDVSVYIRVNDTTDTLVQTVGLATDLRVWSNTSLAISVIAGDYIEFKIVTPNPGWATNPTGVFQSGLVYIQT